MTDALPEAVSATVLAATRAARGGDGIVVAMTGAGISAESGIPTFRGPEGYWQVGSKNYRPESLATHEAFSAMPDEVWAWYLYRRAVCRAAAPNAGHLAVVRMAKALGDRFVLITQNVDGLHARAGSPPERTYEIHGNIDFMRCSLDCVPDTWPLPASIGDAWPKARRLEDAERAALVCPKCGARSRPHVLWFDETYDEHHFRFESSLEAASQAGLLLIVGTSGATTLPNHVARTAARQGAAIVAVNLDPSPFTDLAESLPGGAFLMGGAGRWLPPLADAIESAHAGS